MLTGDSKIMETAGEGSSFPDFNMEEEAIYSTGSSRLYRIRKDGKYFLLKRSAIKGVRGQKILRREYELSIGCDHPNIIDVYGLRKITSNKKEGTDKAEEEFELVMEYVEGRTLTEFMKENPSLKTKKRIFSDLLNAVAYLHQRRIIHNDLKPDNILISRNGDNVKLIDFGLCDDDSHYELKTLGFTDGFAAPELKEDRNSDIRSDIYSLGMIMRCLFGNRYFPVTRKSLRENPAKRFKDVATLKANWKKAEILRKLPIFVFIAALVCMGIVFMINHPDKSELNSSPQLISPAQDNQPKPESDTLEIKKTMVPENVYSPIEKATPVEAGQGTKKSIADDFKVSYNKLISEGIDSIGKGKTIDEIVSTFQIFSMRIKELYEQNMSRATNETERTALTSIIIEGAPLLDKEFLHNLNKKTLEEENRAKESQE